ncbi:MAG: SOS mutagenesis and repair protein UmuC [Desulfobacterales bacterium SG8_35_2]|nr:MAG: SOS mutagenesis and repair protein UmuC [Desulfobacterales bacterium SG8_35_2]
MPSTASEMFGLIDCNNFYVSCERLFRPDLKARPVVVLSNNDGCIIARSEEAKALGIGMGAPYFKQERFIRKHDVAVFSSNYALYGDISQRVMDVLMHLEPDVEIYSIDEAFVRLPAGKQDDLENWGRFLKTTVQKHTGIPVSIGFGPTKTLAKIANRFAKKDPAAAGMFVISEQQPLEYLLTAVPVDDIWGIGRRHAARLKKHSIHTALELANCADIWIRQQLTVTGLRTAMELRGIPCITLDKAGPAKKSICTSRSFGQPVHTLEDLQEAVATYTAQAAYKLRNKCLRASVIDVFIRTNSFKKNEPQYCSRKTFTLSAPSSHTATLIKIALASLKAIYRPGYRYQKAGVLLNGLVPENREQLCLFQTPVPGGETSLMNAVDKINRRWGRDTIQSAAAGLDKDWHFRQMKKSPAYTTSWLELPIVKASFPESFSMA